MADDRPDDRPDEPGFEFKGRFYPWRVSDVGKDLMLIDRFTGMSIADFFDIIEDENERGRGPILLSLIATSLRAGNPQWSVQRIVGAVEALSLSEIEFINSEEPGEAPQAIPPTKPTLAAAPSPSTSTDSSASSTPADGSNSEMSYATPV